MAENWCQSKTEETVQVWTISASRVLREHEDVSDEGKGQSAITNGVRDRGIPVQQILVGVTRNDDPANHCGILDNVSEMQANEVMINQRCKDDQIKDVKVNTGCINDPRETH